MATGSLVATDSVDHPPVAATDALSIFKQRRLQGAVLSALQQEREDHKEEAITEPVFQASELRQAFADLGDEVASKDLFTLVQQADPDGDGVVTLPRFLEVVELRRQQVEKQREEALRVEAYVALGGNADRDSKVQSSLLMSVASDFVGERATARAMESIVAFKLRELEELLGMGGSLDDEEEEELKDTRLISFEEVGAFAKSLHDHGADPLVMAGG